MASKLAALSILCVSCCLRAVSISPDLSGLKSGPIKVARVNETLEVQWEDENSGHWKARFSLDSTKPLIDDISVDGRKVVERATPVYRCSTGKRRGGWDAFFDFPPSAPEGTRSFLSEFHPAAVSVRTVGDRVQVSFNGMKLGIFSGSLLYVFYPGSSLIQQSAVMSTIEPDTAYFYDAGLEMSAEEDRRPGGNMASQISYFDTQGTFQTITPVYGSERHAMPVKYRAIAAKAGSGSIVAFPSPHRYFFARDYTTNMGYLWYTSWRGHVSIGIRQLPDDNSPFYPWMNAPPGTQQEMGMFLLLAGDDAKAALTRVLNYTHTDQFPKLDGFVKFAPHWHVARQFRGHGQPDWTGAYNEHIFHTLLEIVTVLLLRRDSLFRALETFPDSFADCEVFLKRYGLLQITSGLCRCFAPCVGRGRTKHNYGQPVPISRGSNPAKHFQAVYFLQV
jgi:hypothetical protein